MNEGQSEEDDELSLLSIGATLLQQWRSVTRWIFLGSAAALTYALVIPPKYTASASFTVQSSDPNRSGLAALAGQMGIGVPSTNQSASPEFFAMLLKSRTLLRVIARDTILIPEKGGRRIAISDLFEARGRTVEQREEKTVKKIMESISTSVSKPTGVVRMEVVTRWRSASLAIVSALVDGVNAYNMNTRQGQATAERQFVQNRLAVADTEVRHAEDRLKIFFTENRQFTSSPELAVDRDRLQRAVALKQMVFSSLTQSYEDARLREVRETPAITIVEAPAVPTDPESRGRMAIVVIGFLLGALLGVSIVLVSESIKNRRSGDDVVKFFHAYTDAKRELRTQLSGLLRRIRR